MSRRDRTLLAGLGVLLLAGLLWWWLSPGRAAIPETINGFSTRQPPALHLPTDPRTGKPLAAPPPPAHLLRELQAKGLGPAPPPPDPNFLPPLPKDGPPLPPPPPILRLNAQGLPEKVEIYAKDSQPGKK